MKNYHINSNEVIQHSQDNQLARYTSMAILTATDLGVTEKEMPDFLKSFHEYMANRNTVIDSITFAANEILLELPKK
jgi:hypothetical protein